MLFKGQGLDSRSLDWRLEGVVIDKLTDIGSISKNAEDSESLHWIAVGLGDPPKRIRGRREICESRSQNGRNRVRVKTSGNLSL